MQLELKELKRLAARTDRVDYYGVNEISAGFEQRSGAVVAQIRFGVPPHHESAMPKSLKRRAID